jgi:acetyltransferase-like isoleucine patch superfamily enzyme
MNDSVIGADCNIGDHAFVEGGAQIGKGVTLKNGVSIWEGVTLEDYVFVGPNAVFTNDKYPRSPRDPAVHSKYETKDWLVKTRVCKGATIGANATIICGTRIGEYAVVAAGALVTKNVPNFCIVRGSPATVTGYVCICGNNLSEKFVCSECSREFTFENDILTSR